MYKTVIGGAVVHALQGLPVYDIFSSSNVPPLFDFWFVVATSRLGFTSRTVYINYLTPN